MRGMIVTAGRNECDRARVFDPIGVAVDALMQLRRNADGERPKKSDRDKGGNATWRQAVFHCAASLCLFPRQCKEFLLSLGDAPLDSIKVLAYQSRQTRMLGPAKIYFIIFGALTIVGGIIGYVKAGSTASIIAGSISGILLLVAAFLLPDHVAAGLVVALIVSLLLAGRFVPNFIRTGKVMPAGMMSILSVIGLIVAIVAWVKK
jgi:uncharacterized membrane protein (UPF0136 family)